MYTFSKKLKLASFILMAVGLIGMTIGFLSTPSTVAEAHAYEAAASGGHGDDHAVAANHGEEKAHGEEKSHDANTETKEGDAHMASDDDKHGKHLLGQLKNRPWSALYVAAFFFMMIALGALVFYAIQRASQAGWSPLLFRVMEGITSYLLPGLVAVFAVLALSGMHLNHMFPWMDPEVVKGDHLLEGKAGYLSLPFFYGRALVFIAGWVAYQFLSRKFSIAQDNAEDNKNFVKNFRLSAIFLVFFLYSESIMSWDWIMSVDPHWFSTLFGWYLFASMFVSGITVIALVTIYLKSKGYLEEVSNSHIHDLAKFMFGISIFWTYLWFSQFMLIWYANIPEEITYFITRIDDFRLPFFGMVVLNFLMPVLILMNSDYKRLNWFVVMAGILILVGHYMDIYIMIMPATVGNMAGFGIPELSAILFFLGLFIFVVFRALTKSPLVAKGSPFIEESRHFHY